MSGWYYAIGILAPFCGLALVLQEVRFAGAKLEWGFQFQSPIFVELMAGFFFFLAFSLAGKFEIGISMTDKGNSLANRKDYLVSGVNYSFPSMITRFPDSRLNFFLSFSQLSLLLAGT
jgi:thiol:disulfide interchange protein